DPRLTAILDVPRGGQLGDHLPLGRWAHGEEGVKDVVPDPEGEIARGRSLVGVEKSHIARHGEAQGAARLGLLRPAYRRPKQHGTDADQEHEPAHFHMSLLTFSCGTDPLAKTAFRHRDDRLYNAPLRPPSRVAPRFYAGAWPWDSEYGSGSQWVD